MLYLKQPQVYLSSNASILSQFCTEANALFRAFEASAYGACLHRKQNNHLIVPNTLDEENSLPSSSNPQTPFSLPSTALSSLFTTPVTSPTPTVEKKFKCPDCPTSFDYSQNLRRHQNQYH